LRHASPRRDFRKREIAVLAPEAKRMNLITNHGLVLTQGDIFTRAGWIPR
jgi:hypothetical protein